jgi:hypothetical protein
VKTIRSIFLLYALVAAASIGASLSAATSTSTDEEYRKSMEDYRATTAKNERYRAVFLVVSVVVVGSLIAFVAIPSRRDQKAQLAITLENQKVLAEIKVFLERRDR